MQHSSPTENRPLEESLMPASAELAAWCILAAAFVAFFASSIARLGRVWVNIEDYQWCFAVPPFAAYLLWHRRDMMTGYVPRGSWWGLALFACWALMRWTALYFNLESFPEYSMIPFLAGVTLFVGGWQALRWAWPSLLFLVFMLPLPGVVQDIARLQLQKVATILSVFVIQTVGIAAVPDGIVIQLTDKPLRVAEACSGLRMLSMFLAFCIGAAFIVRKPLWEKLLLVASAVPIAIAANVARIVLTAVCCEIARHWPSLVTSDKAEHVIHDYAGLLMPIIGLLLLWLELTLLSKLFIELPDRPLVIGRLEEAIGAGGGRSARGKEHR
ncbi:MAG: exosortase/archaeosortase family protein [Thermoguttaceae bacterium]